MLFARAFLQGFPASTERRGPEPAIFSFSLKDSSAASDKQCMASESKRKQMQRMGCNSVDGCHLNTIKTKSLKSMRKLLLVLILAGFSFSPLVSEAQVSTNSPPGSALHSSRVRHRHHRHRRRHHRRRHHRHHRHHRRRHAQVTPSAPAPSPKTATPFNSQPIK